MSQELEFPWNVYAELKAEEDRITKVGNRERAGDEKLNKLLEKIADGSVEKDATELRRKLVNLEVNQQHKLRHREKLLTSWIAETLNQVYFPEEITKSLEIKEAVYGVRKVTEAREFQILWLLANDTPYRRLAELEGISERALRTGVSRVRERVRGKLTDES